MKLKPLNKTIIIKCEENINEVDSKPIADALKSGIIVLPENNTIQKISDHGRVIRAADDCVYPYLKNQRICYNQFADTPVWYNEDGVRYRIIKESYVRWVYES